VHRIGTTLATAALAALITAAPAAADGPEPVVPDLTPRPAVGICHGLPLRHSHAVAVQNPAPFTTNSDPDGHAVTVGGHLMQPGTAIRVKTGYASLWPGIWFHPAVGADGVAERAPFDLDGNGHFKWPMPGERKFGLIAVFHDRNGNRLTWYDNGPVRRGAFFLGSDSVCAKGPDNIPFFVRIQVNDEYVDDNVTEFSGTAFEHH
jgi:hypothetical protein